VQFELVTTFYCICTDTCVKAAPLLYAAAAAAVLSWPKLCALGVGFWLTEPAARGQQQRRSQRRSLQCFLLRLTSELVPIFLMRLLHLTSWTYVMWLMFPCRMLLLQC
jgi:hypothetical protein